MVQVCHAKFRVLCPHIVVGRTDPLLDRIIRALTNPRRRLDEIMVKQFTPCNWANQKKLLKQITPIIQPTTEQSLALLGYDLGKGTGEPHKAWRNAGCEIQIRQIWEEIL